MLERPAIRAMFEKPDGFSQVWREQRFAMADRDGRPRVGIFDRVVLLGEPGGPPDTVEVIDFKAGVREPTRVAEIGDQMATYREAAAILSGVLTPAVRARVVWLDSSEVEEF